MGVSQARVSQIEHGKVTEVDAIGGYVEALGGTVDVVARWRLDGQGRVIAAPSSRALPPVSG
jgi:hypothetical protein